ncbi:hypothetical protein T01_9412 [Trichinella spiralis]|uniref:Uncharacterized protein n=1 Tax=Trichinella spiralis TaxID=6334 RepID=A0A0V1AYW5_TRISP|nr:hypothetical protein T01_9412 [Trichinella spiralis]
MTFRFALAAQLYNKRFYAIVKSAVVATAMTAESLDSRLPSRRADFALYLLQQFCWMLWSDENHLELLLSYTKRNIMLCSLCLTIPFVIFRLIPISSFGKYYDDEEEYKIMSIEF